MAKARGDRGGRYDALLLLSGGPDSGTLLYHLVKEERKTPLALHFSTGLGPNRLEFAAAKTLAGSLDVPLQVIDISHFVAAGGNAMPTIHSEAHVLRFGTAVILSMAAAFAIQNRIPGVWVALHKEDAAEAVEYSPKFVKFVNSGISLIGSECTIHAPFHAFSKAKLLSMAQRLEVPVEATWSCVTPRGRRQCGVCGACRARHAAFEAAGVSDKTKYAFR